MLSKFPYSLAQVEALAAEMPARYCALVLLLADTGLHTNGALARTRASPVEREHGGMSLRMECSLHRSGQRLVPGPTKTSAGMRTVALMASTAIIMHTHLRNHVGPGVQAFLFPALSGSGFERDTALTLLLHAA